MLKKNKWKELLYFSTYDKPGLNRRAFRIRASLEEVKKILRGKEQSR